MTITQSTVPYEILVRFDTEGAFSGAHIINQDIVRDDDEILNIKSSDAGALTKDELSEFFGNQASDLIENLEGTRKRIEALEQELHDTKSTLQEELQKNAAEPLTRKQMMSGLSHFGLLDSVSAYFSTLPDDAQISDEITGKDAKLIWSIEDYFDPASPLFQIIATVPGFNLDADKIAAMVQWSRANA